MKDLNRYSPPAKGDKHRTMFFDLYNESSSFTMFSCHNMYRSLEMNELPTGHVLAFLIANDMD